MKVVFTIASLDPAHGGPSRSVPALAEALASLGLDLSLVCLRNPGEGAPHGQRAFKLCPVETKANRYVPLGAARRFRGAILSCLNGAPANDVLVHDHGLWLPNNHASARAATHASVRRVVSPRGMLSEWALNARAWKKRVAWVLYQQRDLQSAALLHATSENEAQEFRRLGLRTPIAIIPNGITVPSFPFARGSSRSAPVSTSRFQLPAFSGRTLLFLSRIHPKKGLLDLVNAWARVRRSRAVENWRVVIAGPDEDRHQQELEAAATAAGVRNDFHFIGPVRDEDKWDLYCAADLFVLPSYSENFGIVVGEALAAGLPVITTRRTPWAEIEREQCGWWIEHGVDSLASTLHLALGSSPEQLTEMGWRGRALVERRYSWAVAARDMSAAYAWLLNSGTKPASVHT